MVTDTDEFDYREDERLRRAERLRKRSQYLRAQRKGRRRSGEHFIVYAHPNERGWTRLGVTASKRVGKANVRNWWKRRIREIFRRNKQQFAAGYDLVVIVDADAERADYEELEDELVELLSAATSSN